MDSKAFSHSILDRFVDKILLGLSGSMHFSVGSFVAARRSSAALQIPPSFEEAALSVVARLRQSRELLSDLPPQASVEERRLRRSGAISSTAATGCITSSSGAECD